MIKSTPCRHQKVAQNPISEVKLNKIFWSRFQRFANCALHKDWSDPTREETWYSKIGTPTNGRRVIIADLCSEGYAWAATVGTRNKDEENEVLYPNGMKMTQTLFETHNFTKGHNQSTFFIQSAKLRIMIIKRWRNQHRKRLNYRGELKLKNGHLRSKWQ